MSDIISSQWCYRLLPNLNAPNDSFLTRVVSQGEGVGLTPNQASVFIPLETRWYSCTPGHGVSILVASYDMHGLRWGYSCPQQPHEKSDFKS